MNRLIHWFHLIGNPRKLLDSLLLKMPWALSDRLYIECTWRTKMSYKLDLDNPQTYNEKLQWLKLFDRQPIYTTMVDKYAVKKYVAEIIGEKHIIPTIGVWERPEDIEWDKLPNQFVLKCTHDSGGLVICRDKETLDKKAAIKKLNKSLHNNYYMAGREWPYKNVHRRILAEKFMSDEFGDLRDYKFFCFNGEPKMMFLLKERSKKARLNFYDLDFNKLPFERGYPNFDDEVEKPKGWDEMIKLARMLSKNIPQVRVDFYDINGEIYFGELTFSPGSGFETFYPEEWDKTIGEWIKLPARSLS
ncbi:TupA-like ATPgrasp [Prevotellaceae bacterium MN60]|nr:TupA-like ATPgrasp [Prevotellaceae bacterium MN60]